MADKYEKRTSCPSELKYKVCCRRYNKSHRKMYFHFNEKPIRMVRVEDGSVRCVCRYSMTDKTKLCWERESEEHLKTFCHDV
jgi:hypothetical protein